MSVMTTRERFQAVMNFRPFDRLPILEWATWWTQTIDRWHTEGLPPEVKDRYDICRYFGQDVYVQMGVPVKGPGLPAPSHHGAGIIEDMDDYQRLRECLYPWPAIDREAWRRVSEKQESGEIAMWFTIEGFFWYPRTLLGIEPHLYAFYDKPELMHRMNSDLADHMLKCFEEILSVCAPDFMSFAEDMSYNHGPMLSRELFDEFMMPYYKRILPPLKERGVICLIDSDGDVTVPACWFEEAGLDGIFPLERQAGVDVARLRREHPKMRFMGAFDKMTMNRGEAAMRAEFERLLPTAARGGLLVSCDHQTPPGVSIEDYRLYLRLFAEYAEKAGRMSRGERL
ncbi:MAG TPA: uroporphyrinogen decarboxylase family protein [Candidatus Brocadiia bacterium]|nr:uroporphyrinogen decarboxylase family protein [Candidatus Brocadiia bacterium]